VLCIRGLGSVGYWLQEKIRARQEVDPALLNPDPNRGKDEKPTFIGNLASTAAIINSGPQNAS
jgi:hypothetical protein